MVADRSTVDDPPLSVRWFVLNVQANVEVDFTALEALDAIRKQITRRAGSLWLA
jgi:sulfate permease, SulP family